MELAEGNGPKVTNLTKYYGQSLPNPSARSGYTFVGWYTEPVGGTKVTYAQANQTYYAHWRYNGCLLYTSFYCYTERNRFSHP